MDFAQFFIDLFLFLVYTFGLILAITWWMRFWKLYVNQKFINDKVKWVLLEVKLPREINKSPIAAEIAMHSFLQSGGISVFFDREFLGKMPTYFSLEIASLEGIVHFYIRAESKFRPLIESNFYSQYPGIEISEADDYTKMIRHEHNTNESKVWGVRHRPISKWDPDPFEKDPSKKKENEMLADFKPIKTYIDYGLDKDPKEEYKNDPLTPLIELMGSMGKGEYLWYQILVQDSEGIFKVKFPKTYLNPITHKRVNLSEMAEDYKKGLRRKLKFEKGKEAKDEYGDTKMKPEVKDKEGNIIKKSEPYVYKEDVFETKTEQNLTAEEKDEIEAINLKLSKPLVRALIRLIYVAKPDSYRFEHIQTTLSILKGYTGKYNSFGPVTTDPYDYPWENTMKRRLPWRSEEMFNAYVEREGFFPHVSKRKGLDQAEDIVFFPYKAYLRNTWRVFYEAFFHPFSHPEAVGDVCTLNLEELASLWHLPGAVAQTPTLPRIDSVKGSAPVNLPM